jgi:polyisoprenoid-binding protein YceI
MTSVAVQPFAGTYNAQPVPSTFSFAVRHTGVFWFRGSLSDVTATLRGDGEALVLEGAARVDSVSVVEPAAMRASVLGPEFFDAERHPEVTFSSREIRRDGDAVEIDGEITIKGITQPAKLTGTATGPAVDHFGANRLGLSLETTVDRTAFDINWNMPLPNGEPALANDVTLKAELTLVAQAESTEA